MKIEELYDIYKQFPTVCTDTRNIKKECLFFCLKGDNFNGNKFAKEALHKGAKYAIIDDKQYESENCILVDNVLTTLQNLAAYHRQLFNFPVIGITGSNGKTTTKELIQAVLSSEKKSYATVGNYNNHIGVPLTLLSISIDADIAIIEMGANHKGEIDFLCKISDPDYGLITNIGKAHLEGFGGIQGVIEGKTELYRHIQNKNGKIFINANDEILLENSKNITKITYGEHSKQYQVQLVSSEDFIEIKWKNYNIKTQLTGAYNLPNIAAAIAIGSYFNISENKIIQAIENYTPTNNRSQIHKTAKNKLILDAYNANPTSMEKAIINFAEQNFENKIVIVGDMKEMGEYSLSEHQKVVDLLKEKGFKKVILVGNDFCATNHHFNAYKTINELINFLQKNTIQNATILIKGSRGIRLEKLVEYL